MTRHLRTLDLVQLNACVGHSCDIPLSVAGPPNLNTRAIWERIAIWGVHPCRPFRYEDVKSKSRRVLQCAELGTCMHTLHTIIKKLRIREYSVQVYDYRYCAGTRTVPSTVPDACMYMYFIPCIVVYGTLVTFYD